MYTAEVATEAEKWIEYLGPRIKEKGFELVNVELYIRLDEDKDCLYYLVERKNQTLFWLEDFETDSLGLPEVVSPSHLSKSLGQDILLSYLRVLKERNLKPSIGPTLTAFLLTSVACLKPPS